MKVSSLFVLLIVAVATISAQDMACGCDNVPPPHPMNYSCEQQELWQKCDEDWMAGYCLCTCGVCMENMAPFAEDPLVDYTTDYSEVEVDVATEVAPGEPIQPSICEEREEPMNCASSRARCCSVCPSEEQVDFECKQVGTSFASSCSCASSGSSASGSATSVVSTA